LVDRVRAGVAKNLAEPSPFAKFYTPKRNLLKSGQPALTLLVRVSDPHEESDEVLARDR
jgi:hypothetical protein